MMKEERQAFADTEGKCANNDIFFSILSGDKETVRSIFFFMVKRGWFKNVISHYGPDIELFLDDLYQEVFIALFRKKLDGSLGSIKKHEKFVFCTIKYQSISENKYVDRLYRLDGYEGLIC